MFELSIPSAKAGYCPSCGIHYFTKQMPLIDTIQLWNVALNEEEIARLHKQAGNPA